MRVTKLTVIFVIAMILSAVIVSAKSIDNLNVKNFGAKGDGKTDDTDAILKAITAGAKKKLPVVFVRGEYRVTKPLVITDQSLMGNEPGAWPSDSAPMPHIRVDHQLGPAVTMNGGAAIHGLSFLYDEKKPVKYPPTILLCGVGISITNVRISCCTDGIMADGKNNLGRLNIENVFILSPGNVGLFVTKAYDIPTIRNVEVWNNLYRPKVSAFRFGRVDGLRGSHLVAFGVDVGFDLADDPDGGVWGVFSDCGTDACGVAWRAVGEKGHDVGISGGFFWNHNQAFLLDNPSAGIRVTGAELMSNGSPIVDSIRCHSLILSGCRLARAYENPGVPYLNISSMNALTVGNCIFTPYGPGLTIGQGLKQAVFQGNIFEPSKLPRILKDDRSPTAEIIFSDNAGMKSLPIE